jgi:lysophospholipase L1-like esterase
VPDGFDSGGFDSGTADAALTDGVRCLMPLGDSITQADGNHVSYRYWLWEALQDTDYDVDFVGSLQNHAYNTVATYRDDNFDRDHEGHWAWEANRVRDELPTWLEGYTPGVVLMHLGTNDANRSHPTTGPGGTIGELEDIVGILREDNPEVVILMAQLIPLNAPSTDGAHDRIDELNAAIAALVPTINQPDSPVIFVDQSTGYDASILNYDRFHPNEQGEQRMADVWLEALLPQLAAGRGRCPE